MRIRAAVVASSCCAQTLQSRRPSIEPGHFPRGEIRASVPLATIPELRTAICSPPGGRTEEVPPPRCPSCSAAQRATSARNGPSPRPTSNRLKEPSPVTGCRWPRVVILRACHRACVAPRLQIMFLESRDEGRRWIPSPTFVTKPGIRTKPSYRLDNEEIRSRLHDQVAGPLSPDLKDQRSDLGPDLGPSGRRPPRHPRVISRGKRNLLRPAFESWSRNPEKRFFCKASR